MQLTFLWAIFLTDPPIIWDYYITINPKPWSHTLPKIKLPRNDPENVMQGKHYKPFLLQDKCHYANKWDKTSYTILSDVFDCVSAER